MTISAKSSAWIIIAMSAVFLVFHVLILVGIIPFENTWGGRLENVQQMIVFETISIVINTFLILLLSMNIHLIAQRISSKWITRWLWVYVILFALNTVGNAFAKTDTEKSFALVTLFNVVFLMAHLKAMKKNSAH